MQEFEAGDVKRGSHEQFDVLHVYTLSENMIFDDHVL